MANSNGTRPRSLKKGSFLSSCLDHWATAVPTSMACQFALRMYTLTCLSMGRHKERGSFDELAMRQAASLAALQEDLIVDRTIHIEQGYAEPHR